MQKNGFIRKLWLISKFIMPQIGQQIVFTIHILLNILRRKGNQTMKFGQLIECNLRNIFLAKSYRKCRGEASPRPFCKKSKLIGIDSLKCYKVCFYSMSKSISTKIY